MCGLCCCKKLCQTLRKPKSSGGIDRLTTEALPFAIKQGINPLWCHHWSFDVSCSDVFRRTNTSCNEMCDLLMQSSTVRAWHPRDFFLQRSLCEQSKTVLLCMTIVRAHLREDNLHQNLLWRLKLHDDIKIISTKEITRFSADSPVRQTIQFDNAIENMGVSFGNWQSFFRQYNTHKGP